MPSQEISTVLKQSSKSLYYDLLFNKNKNYGCDTLSLKRDIKSLSVSSDPDLLILYKILMGKGIAECYDRYNAKSNLLFEQAIHSSKKVGNGIEVIANMSYAKYLYNYRQMSIALPYFLRAEHLLENGNPSEQINAKDSYKWIGYYFGTIGDTESSIKALEKAKTLSSESKEEYAAILDALGLLYLGQGNTDRAEQYFRSAMSVAKNAKDEMRFAKATGNLGLVMKQRGKIDSAKVLLKQDIEISERFSEDQNTMFAMTNLAEIDLQTGDLLSAEQNLNGATEIYISKPYFAVNGLAIEKLKAQLYRKLGKTQNELESYHRISELELSVLKTDGDPALKSANLLRQKAKLQQINREAQYQKEKGKIMRLVYISLFAAALLFAGFIFANSRKELRNRELRYKQKVLGLELEQVKIEQKLTDAREDLGTQIDLLRHKNILIQQLKNEIEKIGKSSSSYLEKQQKHLSTLLESHLMTDENWNNFKKEFTKAYPDFYAKLQRAFPDLTEANYRVILLQKLNFSNNEISELLGITLDAVKKSKQRLKKKLGDRYADLSEIITESGRS